MAWEFKLDRPIYSQLIEQVEISICSGVYAPGSRLPSVRELAREAAVNPNTMQKALAKLEEEGLLYTNRTSGRFVTEDVQMIQQVKYKLAEEQIAEFLEKMKDLGFAEVETLSIIKDMLKEGEK